jgi:hypothetical protein
MTDQQQILIIRAALNSMFNGPRSLEKAITNAADLEDVGLETGDTQKLLSSLVADDPNLEPRLKFERFLHEWDNIEAADWCDGTTRNTPERRQAIYRRLKISAELTSKADDLFPVHQLEAPTIIALDHEEWYTNDRKQKRQFYWPALNQYLVTKQKWPVESVSELDNATDAIVGRLSDPERIAAYQTKGLVVGYVQSGKTANFTGVIAKAADAGYRLVIVLGGTLNILRDQTQRRLDKELVGREMLGDDYDGALDIEEFLAHGCRPSEKGSFDWHRLTGPEYEYKSLRRGIDALEFERFDLSRPLYDTVNLHRIKARLMVVKKQKIVLDRLIRDFKQLRTKLTDIPTLIIDDESDQASINTRPAASQERTAINQKITDLLKLFPRGQYVGYTATPFANVFINPDDAEDLFPKDYIVSLPRPRFYMGLQEFVDSEPVKQQDRFGSKEACYVRDVDGQDTVPDNFQKAIDSFILAGAMKLYRQEKMTGMRFKHHTMLVHISHLQAEHENIANTLRAVYESSGFDSSAGLQRLKRLWTTDILPVCVKKGPDLARPADFAELESYIGECIGRVDERKSVLVVNGDDRYKDDTPNFEKQPVWAILVGGNKLSRGYTVEGLTISYYRRLVNTADTMMQMGRWFGFRRGYHDLVRLFIGRNENGLRDIYDEYKDNYRMEEEFRSDLKRYSEQTQPRIRPAQVPPLVPASGRIRPTATNRMYNAIVVSQNFAGEWSESTTAPSISEIALVQQNQQSTSALLASNGVSLRHLACDLISEGESAKPTAIDVLFSEPDAHAVIKFLKSYRWMKDDVPASIVRQIEYLEGKAGDPGIAGWRILAFQSAQSFGTPWAAAGQDFNCRKRSRTRTHRFGAYTEPNHRAIAAYLADIKDERAVRNANTALAAMRDPSKGVLLFYPVRQETGDPVSIGFALLFPKNGLQFQLHFSVRDLRQPNAITVPNSAASTAILDVLANRATANIAEQFGTDRKWKTINSALWAAIRQHADHAISLTDIDGVAKMASVESEKVLAVLALLSRPASGLLEMRFHDDGAAPVSNEEVVSHLKRWWKTHEIDDDTWRAWAGKVIVRWVPAADSGDVPK